MTSTGSFGELEVTTDSAQGTGSFDHVKATTFEGDGVGLANVLPLNAFETGVVLTSDGSATITLANIIFITTNNGELILYE